MKYTSIKFLPHKWNIYPIDSSGTILVRTVLWGDTTVHGSSNQPGAQTACQDFFKW